MIQECQLLLIEIRRASEFETMKLADTEIDMIEGAGDFDMIETDVEFGMIETAT